MIDDIAIRFEAVKISSKQLQASQGVMDILFDAQLLYDYIKSGKLPELDKVA